MKPESRWKWLAGLMHRGHHCVGKKLLLPVDEHPPNKQLLDECYHEARNSDLQDLFIKHLLSAVFLSEAEPPEWITQWLEHACELSGYLGPFSLEQATGADWTAFPVILCHGSATHADRSCSVAWFLVGHFQGRERSLSLPPFAKRCLDGKTSIFAIDDAFLALSDRPGWRGSVLILPLASVSSKNITGASLALPVVLAMHLASTGMKWPKGLFATGAVSTKGEIKPVHGVDAKAAHVAPKARLFLCPGENAKASHCDSDCIVPVNALDEAIEIMELHCNNFANREALALIRNRSQGGTALLDSIMRREISPRLLKWAGDHGKLFRLTNELSRLPNWIKLVDALETLGSDTAYAEIICDLCDIDETRRLIENGNDSVKAIAFKWASLQLATANHLGHPDKAGQWATLAHALENKADSRDWYVFINRQYGINTRHNRYDFRTDLPEQFNEAFRRRREMFAGGKDSDYALAAFYGTMAQNLAFCSPANISRVEEYTLEAMKRFGHGMFQDALRQWSYLVYARLDAGDIAGASEALKQYLSIPRNMSLEERILETDGNPRHLFGDLCEPDSAAYSWAAIMRWYADAGGRPEISGVWPVLRKLMDNILEMGAAGHPFQLIFHNLGRVAVKMKERSRAESAWRRSVDICLHENREKPTLIPMALLPLSYLWEEGFPVDLGDVKRVADFIGSSGEICKEHFTELLELHNGEQILTVVAERGARFFPFSYR